MQHRQCLAGRHVFVINLAVCPKRDCRVPPRSHVGSTLVQRRRRWTSVESTGIRPGRLLPGRPLILRANGCLNDNAGCFDVHFALFLMHLLGMNVCSFVHGPYVTGWHASSTLNCFSNGNSVWWAMFVCFFHLFHKSRFKSFSNRKQFLWNHAQGSPLGYLENPLDPSTPSPLDPQPSTHDPRPSTQFKKKFLFVYIIITFL